MVIDNPYSSSARPLKETYSIARVQDRVLAFFIDLLLFFPLCSLVVSRLVYDFRVKLMLGSETAGAGFILFKIMTVCFLFGALCQALSLYFLNATPGQKIMKIRVISMTDRGQLSFYQCLVRSFLFWSTTVFVLPLVGVLTHPLRKTFADLGSDTLVVSQKGEVAGGPSPDERRFFTQWKTATLAMLIFGFGLSFVSGSNREDDAVGSMLSENADACIADGERAEKVLDEYLAGYFATGVFDECAEPVAEKVLWSSEEGSWRSLAYLMKSIIVTAKDEALVYAGKVCKADAKGEACGLREFLDSEEDDRADLLRARGLSLVSSRVLLLREAVENDQLASALALAKDLRSEEFLRPWLMKQEVRAAWKLNKGGSRTPASEKEDLLGEFKERYEIE